MSDRRRLSPKDRKMQLVAMAIETVAEIGIERTGHGDIAKRAGVSTATVFNYFPTKDALTKDILDEIEHQVMTMFKTVQKHDLAPKAHMMALVTAYETMFKECPNTIKAYLSWGVSFNPGLRPQYLDMHERILDLVQDNLPSCMQNRTDALIIKNAANLLSVMMFDNASLEEREKYITRMLDALLPTESASSL